MSLCFFVNHLLSTQVRWVSRKVCSQRYLEDYWTAFTGWLSFQPVAFCTEKAKDLNVVE